MIGLVEDIVHPREKTLFEGWSDVASEGLNSVRDH